jgi:hypothetical protein
MRKSTINESFAVHVGLSAPSLRAVKNPKTMCVAWYGGVLAEHEGAFALDDERMNAELYEVWRRYRSQCDRRAYFGRGAGAGSMTYVPHAAGFEVMNIVREYFTKALVIVSTSDTHNA